MIELRMPDREPKPDPYTIVLQFWREGPTWCWEVIDDVNPPIVLAQGIGYGRADAMLKGHQVMYRLRQRRRKRGDI